MAPVEDELWTCPKCGHRFTTKNMWHSCSTYPLEYHFEGRLPLVRSTFDRFLEVIEMHKAAADVVPAEGVPTDLLDASRQSWAGAPGSGQKRGYKNGQVTVLAPTGTLAFLMY